MERTVKVSVTTENGILLDTITITIPTSQTVIHLIPTKPDALVIGSEHELNLGK